MMTSSRSPTKRTGGQAVDSDESRLVQQRLLDAAVGCLAHYGLAKTSMEDVARSAGMSRATLYRHFKNRDDLLMGVVEREARATARVIEERLAHIADPGEHIVEGILQTLSEIPKRPTLSMLMRPEAVGMTSRLVLNSERIADIALEIVVPVIEPAREKGLLRENVGLDLMVEWIYRVLISYLTVPSATAKNEHELRDQLRSMLLPALLR
jgi:AcrR family transcriptional regulator